jgi:hypothetical protein
VIVGGDTAVSAYAPVRPDQTTAAVLEATFGQFLNGKLRPGWSMWLNAGHNGDGFTPQRFDEPVSALFMLAGEVETAQRVPGPRPDDEVTVFSLNLPQRRAQAVAGGRIRVETPSSLATLLSLCRTVEAPTLGVSRPARRFALLLAAHPNELRTALYPQPLLAVSDPAGRNGMWGKRSRRGPHQLH